MAQTSSSAASASANATTAQMNSLNLNNSSPEKIRLNVGGFRFETTLSTLTRDPVSMLGRMFSDDWQDSDKLANEETFIDRDGRHFHLILNFLRYDCRCF